jgi:hypothetical protein
MGEFEGIQIPPNPDRVCRVGARKAYCTSKSVVSKRGTNFPQKLKFKENFVIDVRHCSVL